MAADVTQDVFIKLWENGSEMDVTRVLSWLLKVARNACIDQIRKRKVRFAITESADFSLDSISSETHLPDAIASNAIFDVRLKKALHAIGEPFQSIIILREMQDYKYEEIAEMLDLPLNTVKVYLHRARKALREKLKTILTNDLGPDTEMTLDTDSNPESRHDFA